MILDPFQVFIIGILIGIILMLLLILMFYRGDDWPSGGTP